MNNNQDLTLNIYYQNVCGLWRKVNELVLLLSQDFPQIVFISEHHLKKSQICITVMENYKLIASYCRNDSMEGVTCIFLHAGISFDEKGISR